jgi:hypothetical protein
MQLSRRLGSPVNTALLSVARQVVAGTNFKLKLSVKNASLATKVYEATVGHSARAHTHTHTHTHTHKHTHITPAHAQVWEKLPHYGGGMELTRLEEVAGEEAGTHEVGLN